MTDLKPPLKPAIPDHDLFRCVGQGSYGEVWLGRSILGTWRAIKTVRRDRFKEERPFLREFEGIQHYEPVSRSHPGLVNILHVGQGEGWFYYVMEAADDAASGPLILNADRYISLTLAQKLLQQSRFSVRESIALGMALADALAFLHSQGLGHRDIKPSNIIYVNGKPKLADVGLVTRLGKDESVVGTPGYLPPEGSGTSLADIYSLGKVLYEITMGKDCDEFPSLPSALRDLPDASELLALNRICVRACAPAPIDRYPSAADMRDALAALAAQYDLSPAVGKSSLSRHPGTLLVLNTGPDSAADPLLTSLASWCHKQGLAFRCDRELRPSLTWGRSLEEWLNEATVVIALFTPDCCDNDMLAYGINLTGPPGMDEKRYPRLLAVSVHAGQPKRPLTVQALNHSVKLAWNSPNDDADLQETLMKMLKP